MKVDEAITRIDDFIKMLANEMEDDDKYAEALYEMENRAALAIDALAEVQENARKSSETDSGT